MNPNSEGDRYGDRSSAMAPLLWPLIMTAAAADAAAAFFKAVWSGEDHLDIPTQPTWASENRIALELSTMCLRDFSRQASGQSTLICAPFALHGATIADFAPGHSVVEVLRHTGLSRVFVTDWRSAAPEMRFFTIDNYLADLNIAVDDIKPPVDLIGLCQGGWLALAYAARFPAKVRRLVLAGAPIDFHAAPSNVSRAIGSIPFFAFEHLVESGNGRVLGQHVLEALRPALNAERASQVLQLAEDMDSDERRELEACFRNWNAWTVDLPGQYYLEVVDRLYRHNQIARNEFVALGRPVSLADVHARTFLLAGRDDQVVAPEQLFAAARLVGTHSGAVEQAIEECGHLSLFLGSRALAGTWPRIGRWLNENALAIAS